MKKILVILIILAVLMQAGCAAQYVEKELGDNSSVFVCVEETARWDVLYHKDTRVMYILTSGGSFTLLVNADGSPMLWDGGN